MNGEKNSGESNIIILNITILTKTKEIREQ
jgi:hypothetical protein